MPTGLGRHKPNAGSARVTEIAGAKAIATSSAAVAWAHGYPDGEALPFDILLNTVREVSRVVSIPITADIEAGYGQDDSSCVDNVGYLVDANVYHPGDSLIVPNGVNVQTLLVPIHAPWSKVGEVVDFVICVRGPQAFSVHDGLLNEMGRGLVEGHVTRIGAKYGTAYRHLSSGDSVEV